MSKTNYLEEGWLDAWYFGTSLGNITRNAASPDTEWWVTLFTADPTESGVFTNEAGYDNFLRESIDRGPAAGDFSRTGSILSNDNAITFNTATTDPTSETVTYWGIVDAETLGTGNLMIYGQLSGSGLVVSWNTTPSFDVGELTYDED